METQMVWPYLQIVWHGKEGQFMEQEEEAKRRDGKTTSRNEQELELEIPWVQEKTENGGIVSLQRHKWCPDDRQG